ncbi:MAG TPA: hypothetical protein VG982_02835 [Candidatus Paceibacterota bacterium]|jgi:hypothetical protein|nr:hypothetical protein [Candidatus Paceibacterota bacterium]
MKYPEQNPESEDGLREMNEMRKKKSTEQWLNGVAAAPETYPMEEIGDVYRRKHIELSNEIKNVENYLNVKSDIDRLRYVVETTPQNSRTVNNFNKQMMRLKDYEAVVEHFEKNKVPEEVLEHAKRLLDELRKLSLSLPKKSIIEDETLAQEN